MILKRINFVNSRRYLGINSISYNLSSKLIIDKHEKVEVFFSDSNDIYYNLGLEQLLYEKDLKYPRMMLWKNRESVIIGILKLKF